VLLVVPDLFFAARIRETAGALGLEVTETSPAAAAAAARALGPVLVIVDLHAVPAAAETVRALRAAAPQLTIVGFHPHVEVDARDAALAAGADRMLPRSAFTRQLADLLAKA
jgi:DNA-binding NarL/FixJ family response regulator